MKKERLDLILQNKGLAESRSKAQAIIMEGWYLLPVSGWTSPGRLWIPMRRSRFGASCAPM